MTQKDKIVLIGCGAVGTSFLYSLLNRVSNFEFVLIDAFVDAAEGNKLDLQDASALLAGSKACFRVGKYTDCANAKVIVICAGRPSKPGETRLDLISDNAKIMAEIATGVKNSGFNGITVIASNPCDVLTTVYQKTTGFATERVFSSGTWLDTARMRIALAQVTKLPVSDIPAFVIGEHGDSSVGFVVESAKLPVTDVQIQAAHQIAVHKAYDIIKLKRATFYGIGCSLSTIVLAIINDENLQLAVGAYHDQHQLYVGQISIVNAKGAIADKNFHLPENVINAFEKSCALLQQSVTHALKSIA